MRKSPRQRRLEADFRGVCNLRDESTIFSFLASGEPPQKYRLIFKGNGIYRSQRGEIKISDHHECLIEFGAAYPRLVPNLAWQTPIYHPNISNNGVVCLGGYGTNWVPSLTLSELCTMLWDMIRYKNFDTESPYNREAAMWAKMQTDFQFPLDPRSIRDQLHTPAAPTVVDVPATNRPSMPEVQVMPADSILTDGIEVIDVTEDGIEIINAEVARPAPPRGDDGILFLD